MAAGRGRSRTCISRQRMGSGGGHGGVWFVAHPEHHAPSCGTPRSTEPRQRPRFGASTAEAVPILRSPLFTYARRRTRRFTVMSAPTEATRARRVRVEPEGGGGRAVKLVNGGRLRPGGRWGEVKWGEGLGGRLGGGVTRAKRSPAWRWQPPPLQLHPPLPWPLGRWPWGRARPHSPRMIPPHVRRGEGARSLLGQRPMGGGWIDAQCGRRSRLTGVVRQAESVRPARDSC